MDQLTAMRVFAKVVDTGSFTRAAERLGLSATAASRHVADLEAHLGARLLNRTTRRVSVTDAGRAYHERCRAILEDLDEADAVVGAASARPAGTLRLNAPVSFGAEYIGPLLPDYLARHPGVEIDVTLSDRIVDIVEEGYDLVVRIGREIHTTLIARRIAGTRMIACAAPSYLAKHGAPRTPEDLARHACLGYSYWRAGNEWDFEGATGRHVVTVHGALRANNGAVLQAAAIAGLGIILQPEFQAGPALRSGELVALLPEYRIPPLGIHAVYPSRRHLSAKVRTFVDFLVERLGPRPPWEAAPPARARPAGKGRR